MFSHPQATPPPTVPQTDFDVLGLAPRFDLSLAELEARQRELGKALHPDRFSGAPPRERRAALSKAIEVNEAVRRLKDPVWRGRLLLQRSFGVDVNLEPAAPTALLLDIMQLREALATARGAADQSAVEALDRQISERRALLLRSLSAGFEALAASTPSGSPSATSLNGISTIESQLVELKYLERFIEEVKRIQDELF